MSVLRSEARLCRQWSDIALTEGLADAARHERACLIALLVRLGEFDRRKLDRKKGYPHAYDYCMRALLYSRSAAARRIAAARAGRKFPSLLAMLESGELPLVGAALLAPHLTSGNHRRLLRAARGRSQDEIARLVAALVPGGLRRDSIRVNVSQSDAGAAGANASASVGADVDVSEESLAGTKREAVSGGTNLSSDSSSEAIVGSELELFVPDAFRGERPAVSESPVGSRQAAEPTYTATITLSSRTHGLLMRAKEVMSHRAKDGGFDAILEIALDLLLDSFDRDRKMRSSPHVMTRRALEGDADNGMLLEGRKDSGMLREGRTDSASARTPALRSESQSQRIKARSRYIPEAVRQAVWKRDGGRCAFVGTDGVACRSREALEFDHKLPYALGGPSDLVDNIRLLCRAHNVIVAEQLFGPRFS